MNKLFRRSRNLASILAISAVTLAAFVAKPVLKLAYHSTPPAPPPLPSMWMDDNTTKTDEGYFQRYFNPKLAGIAHHRETNFLFYNSQAFKSMVEYCGKLKDITYLDMYPVIPPAGDTMAVLFVPKDRNQLPLAYLKITPSSTTWPQKDDAVQQTDAINWMTDYINRIAQLNNELSTADSGNYKHCTTDPNEFSNTVYLHHYYKDFVELDSELSIQHNSYSTDISGIEASFAARPDIGAQQQYSLSKRLYIILDFTVDDANKNHQIFYIKTDNRAQQKPNLPLYQPCPPPKSRTTPPGGNNNGQMCPPTCNP